MSIIILETISQLSAFGLSASAIANQFKSLTSRLGSSLHRNRTVRVVNDVGSVTSITDDIAAVKLFVFDLFSSSVMGSAGVSSKMDSMAGKKDVPRAYADCDADVLEGDYLLVNYDAGDGSFDAKYLVLEREAHVYSDVYVFYTLYLKKVEL